MPWEWLAKHPIVIIIGILGGLASIVALVWMIIARPFQKKKEKAAEKRDEETQKILHEMRDEIKKVHEQNRQMQLYLDGIPEIRDKRKAVIYRDAFRVVREYRHEEAIAKFQELLPLAANDSERCAILNLIGFNQCKIGNFKEAKNTFQAMINIAEATKHDDALVVGLGNIGIVFDTLGDAENALDAHLRALKIDIKMGDLLGQAKQYINLGSAYFLSNEFERARDSFEEALRINEKIRNHSIQANALGNIGILYRIQGDLDRALEFLEKALDEAEQTGEREIYADWLSNLAVVNDTKGEHGKAFRRLKQALEINKSIGNTGGEAYQIFNIGNIYYGWQEFDKALSHFQQARTIFERIGSVHMIKDCDQNIAITQQKLAEQGK